MTKIGEITIKQPVFNNKFVNGISIDKIYRYREYGNREYIANFSIRDITIKDDKIDTITFSKDGEKTTFQLNDTSIVRYIYENTNSDFIELLPASASGEQLLGANSLLYLFVLLLIKELNITEKKEEKKTKKNTKKGKKKTKKQTKTETKEEEVIEAKTEAKTEAKGE